MLKLPKYFTAHKLLSLFDIKSSDLRALLIDKVEASPYYQSYVHLPEEEKAGMSTNALKWAIRMEKKRHNIVHAYISYLLFILLDSPISNKTAQQFAQVYLKAKPGTPIRIHKGYYVIR